MKNKVFFAPGVEPAILSSNKYLIIAGVPLENNVIPAPTAVQNKSLLKKSIYLLKQARQASLSFENIASMLFSLPITIK